MERIQEKRAGFRSLTEAIDTTTPAGRMMMQMAASFAELVKLQQEYRKSHRNSAFFSTSRRVVTFVRRFNDNGLRSRSPSVCTVPPEAWARIPTTVVDSLPDRSVSSLQNRPTKPVFVLEAAESPKSLSP